MPEATPTHTTPAPSPDQEPIAVHELKSQALRQRDTIPEPATATRCFRVDLQLLRDEVTLADAEKPQRTQPGPPVALDLVQLQIAQLRVVAEDPRIRPSVRIEARRALKALVPPARPVIGQATRARRDWMYDE